MSVYAIKIPDLIQIYRIQDHLIHLHDGCGIEAGSGLSNV